MYHKNGNCDGRMVFGDSPFTSKAVVGYGKRPWYSQPWQGYNVTVTARYLTLFMDSPTTINEVVVYVVPPANRPASAEAPLAPQTPRPGPMMDTFLGVNGFVDDPVSRLSAVGSVREYQDWSWTEGTGDPGYPHALTKFEPT